ncbi:MAG: tandem-95 repeat protein, partial [Verrucomicrobiota bacterium]
NGLDSFTYSISDGNGGTDLATVTVDVNSVNDLPTANDDSDSTDEGTPVVISVLPNDNDPDGDPLRVINANNGGNGTTSINSDGTITYTPANGFDGQDSFTYTISDGNGGTDTATVTVDVIDVNSAPDAVDDKFTAAFNNTLQVNKASGVLGNDSDPEMDNLSVINFDSTSASGGSISMNADGSFDYTPAAGFTGDDSFTYTVSDGNGGQDTAIVQIDVGDIPGVVVNQFPVTSYFAPVFEGPEAAKYDGPQSLTITTESSEPVKFVVERPDGTIEFSGYVTKDSPFRTDVDVDFLEVPETAQVLENAGFVVKSDDFVRAVYENDSTLNKYLINGKPIVHQGTEFIAASTTRSGAGNEDERHYLSIMSTEDNTKVLIEPDNPLIGPDGNPTTTPWEVTLNQGESYVVISANYLSTDGSASVTGTRISSNNDITVTSGTQHVTSGFGAKEGSADQLVAVDQLGSEYIMVSSDINAGYDHGMVVAAYDGTDVFVNGTKVATLNTGDHYDVTKPDTAGSITEVTTSQPAYAYDILGVGSNGEFGMTAISPREGVSGTNEVNFVKGDGTAQIGIIVDADNASQIELNGVKALSIAEKVSTTADGETTVIWLANDVVDGVNTLKSDNNALFDVMLSNGTSGSGGKGSYITAYTNFILGNPDLFHASDNGYVMSPGGSLSPDAGQNLIANDFGEGTITVNTTPVSGPSNGSLTLNADGSFTYTPNPGFNGVDSFVYEATNGTFSAQATVNIGVGTENAIPPVVIDLDGDGAEFDSIAEGIEMDVDGDGLAEKVAWADEDDGVLVYDGNDNNNVDDTSEFAFAQYSDDANATDLEGLRAFDTNQNGALDTGDDEFEKFKVWQDSNGDGKVDEGEMRTAAEVGIESIELTSDNQEYIAGEGNVKVHGTAEVNYSDGSTGEAADAEFFYSESDSQAPLEGDFLEDLLDSEEAADPLEISTAEGGTLDLDEEQAPQVPGDCPECGIDEIPEATQGSTIDDELIAAQSSGGGMG